MLRQLRFTTLLAHRTYPNAARNTIISRRLLNTEAKYAEKLRQAAASRGITVEELRAEVKEAELKRRKDAAASPPPHPPRNPAAPPPQQPASSSDASKPASPRSTRHDNSPVKPLNNIFNIARLLDTPHTAEQVSALWTAYHQTRSGGTGRGYLCAAVPVAQYEALLAAGRRFPTFILPLSRGQAPDAPADSNQQAYEFFVLQWAQYHSPPVPTYESETSPFPLPSTSGETNPPTSTVIFAPLAEYKLRQDFAAPQLVLTFHTELAKTHGIVLLRGELTPTGTHDAEGKVKYWLTQEDGQLLAMNLQRFYLWQGKGTEERQQLLTAFHEHPAEFNWEDLLKHAQPV